MSGGIGTGNIDATGIGAMETGVAGTDAAMVDVAFFSFFLGMTLGGATKLHSLGPGQFDGFAAQPN